jgi:hypothetical protein
MRRFLLGGLLIAIAAGRWTAADPEPEPAVLTDAAGKEVKLRKWRFSAGTRTLDWLPGDKARPQALEFRDVNSTLYRDGVLTLVPLDRLKSLRYDPEKQTVTAEVAGAAEPLVGSTRYTGINALAVEAEVDMGADGVADVKYKGGPFKGGIRGLQLTGARAPDKKPAGDAFTVRVAEPKQKLPPQVVYNLRAVYRVGKGELVPSPTVTFKKTLKVDLAKVKKLVIAEPPKRDEDAECEVTFKDGGEQTLTLLASVTLDGKPAVLEGLLGEVPAGFKLFPVHTVGELIAGEVKDEKIDE